jgi:hypothetical protein
LAEIHRSCAGRGFDAVAVVLRWLIRHSQLNAERNDGVITGVSSLEQRRHNLAAVTDVRAIANRCPDCDRPCSAEGLTEMATLFLRRLPSDPGAKMASVHSPKIPLFWVNPRPDTFTCHPDACLRFG